MAEQSLPYEYQPIDQGVPHTDAYLMTPLRRFLEQVPKGARVLDVGCGNGHYTGGLAALGYDMTGVDLSETGIASARQKYPKVRFEQTLVDDGVLDRLGVAPFDAIVSTEVIEHLYAPRPFIKACFQALRPGGLAVFSTPYNGWLKNVVVAVANKYDWHHNPLWDGGHIKFWSRRTLGQLMEEAGFRDLQFAGAGRLPWLWMSMFMAGRKPA